MKKLCILLVGAGALAFASCASSPSGCCKDKCSSGCATKCTKCPAGQCVCPAK